MKIHTHLDFLVSLSMAVFDACPDPEKALKALDSLMAVQFEFCAESMGIEEWKAYMEKAHPDFIAIVKEAL